MQARCVETLVQLAPLGQLPARALSLQHAAAVADGVNASEAEAGRRRGSGAGGGAAGDWTVGTAFSEDAHPIAGAAPTAAAAAWATALAERTGALLQRLAESEAELAVARAEVGVVQPCVRV